MGVVLSGTATDGSLGLCEIKAGGGITFAQTPETAKYDGMPRAAIAAEGVDLILSPGQIARELTAIATHRDLPHPPQPSNGGVAAEDGQMGRIFMLLRAATGVDFNHYKPPTIRRRLKRRMDLHKLENLEQYLKFLSDNASEVQELYRDILIHVTHFFREPESFEAVKQVVYPRLVEGRRGDVPIRIWIPGCSTGEEAYSVAITLLEFLTEGGLSFPVQVFATDVGEIAIERAQAGIYPENIAEDVSPERLQRFFTRVDGNYQISKLVRGMCVFARQDLTRDPPFSRIDLIVCRNVLIYLAPTMQKKLMTIFHYALRPTGFLVLGSAETVGAHSDLFSVAEKRHRVYTKKSVDRIPEFHFPVEYSPGRRVPQRSGRGGIVRRPRAGRRQSADSGKVQSARRDRGPRFADHSVSRPDRKIPRTRPRRRHVWRAADGQRRDSVRPAHRESRGQADQKAGASRRAASQVGRRDADGRSGSDSAGRSR